MKFDSQNEVRRTSDVRLLCAEKRCTRVRNVPTGSEGKESQPMWGSGGRALSQRVGGTQTTLERRVRAESMMHLVPKATRMNVFPANRAASGPVSSTPDGGSRDAKSAQSKQILQKGARRFARSHDSRPLFMSLTFFRVKSLPRHRSPDRRLGRLFAASSRIQRIDVGITVS